MDKLMNAWCARAARSAIAAGVAALALSVTAGAQCPADFNGSGDVDGADLGYLLGAWGTPNPTADLNHDGLVDGADLGFLLGAWGPCPINPWTEYSKLQNGVSMVLQTPQGPRTVIGDMGIAFSVGSADVNGNRPVILDRLTFSLTSTTVFSSQTGGISMVASDEMPPGNLGPGGQLNLPLSMNVHYWMINQLLPPDPTECTEVGGSMGFAAHEVWNGSINWSTTETPTDLFVTGTTSLVNTTPITGLLSGGTTTTTTTIPKKTYPGLEECAADKKCNKMVVCIQPVFIGTGAGDATATGKSYNAMKAKADEAWAKCCIEFNWLAPKYINKPEYKTLKRKATGNTWEDHDKLLAEEDAKGENECIEVFFVTHMQNSAGQNNDSGDGVTDSSGTKNAKIIVADDATEACDRKSDGVLAHELGHACGNCQHPDGKASAAGTCMEPTGKAPPNCPGVNNTKVNSAQCKKARGGPLAKEKMPKAPCCLSPDG